MKSSPKTYTRYPLINIITYNGITVLHFLLGGLGLILGYGSWPGYISAAVYTVFAFAEMYIVMPFKVCPSCPYFKLDNSVCISGLNVLSKKFVKEGNIKDFQKRAEGVLCSNNLYLAGFIIPIIALIPALIINFSFIVLAIFLMLTGLLGFRFFIIFPKLACGCCRAKNICPNARSMGLNSDTKSTA